MAKRNARRRPVPSNPYRDVFEAMNDAGIRYLVIGGVAVNLHGYPRFTGDLDILLALDCRQSTPEQRLEWLAAAREFAFVPKRRRRSDQKG